MRRCSNCNSPLDPDGCYCGACGHDNGELERRCPDLPKEKPTRRIPRWIIIGGVLVILLCCVVAIGGFVMVQMVGGLDFTDIEELLDPGDSPGLPSVDTSSQIYDVWMDHNVEYEGQEFMIFHIEHEIFQADSATAAVVVFLWREDGSPMPSYEPDYNLAGQAAVMDLAQVSISPSSYWGDYQLWIPYYAMEAGENQFATVELQDTETERILGTWKTEPFHVFP